MIIASLLPQKKEDIIAIKDLRILPECIEFRLDTIDLDEALEALQHVSCKKIAACRRQEDGGSYRGSEKERTAILEKAIHSALFDYIDVEMDSESFSLFKKHPKKRFIISYHDIKETPDDITGKYRRLCSLKGASFYKIVTYAKAIADNLKIKEVLKSARSDKLPLISFCMGEKGMLSRILCMSWGSKGVYASIKRGRETAAGQISHGELMQSFDIERIDPSTKIFAVLGYPLKHSLSPAVHNAAYRSLNLHYACIPFETRDLEEVFDLVEDIHIAGFAITSPLKEKAMNFAATIENDARRIGSVNTIIAEGSQFSAYNTDWRAFLRELLESVPDLKNEKIAVLGDGGVAHAVAHALKKQEASFSIFSRNKIKGEEIAQRYESSWQHIEGLADFDYSVLVNCTTAGMYPEEDSSPIGEESLRGRFFYDLIYNPPVTKLMKMAMSKGIEVKNGKGMFLGQAALQFELLTGQKAPGEVMERAFQEGLHFLDKENDG